MENLIQTLAPTEVPLLICGETGTGKEVLARRVHTLSGRKGPFVAVNCGAISEQLAESELFGHEAGSFTGATARREGWFEAAQTGTLFLDEVGDLPIALQVKLLRAIQEKEITRVGSRKPLAVSVRIIAATSVDLDQAISAGRFRRDLYYRLSGGVFRLPTLRESTENIVLLSEQFLRRLASAAERTVPKLTEAALAKLLRHSWPGNIRELENVIHLAFLTRTDGTVDAADLRIQIPSDMPLSRSAGEIMVGQQRGDTDGAALLAGMRGLLQEMFMHSADSLFTDLERLIVTEAFTFARQNQVHSAALLGLSRNVLRTLLKRHGLIIREPGPPLTPVAAPHQGAYC